MGASEEPKSGWIAISWTGSDVGAAIGSGIFIENAPLLSVHADVPEPDPAAMTRDRRAGAPDLMRTTPAICCF